ncbi:hypothetical protein CAPTEDRAFT_126272, partial [Capitella teleta]
GALFVPDCPRQHMIPIYLIVIGSCVLIRSILSLVGFYRLNNHENSRDVPLWLFIADFIHSLFVLCWFIAGSVWVFGIHEDHQDSDPDQQAYCATVLYQYAFWCTVMCYVLAILCIIYYVYRSQCCCFLLATLKTRSHKSNFIQK